MNGPIRPGQPSFNHFGLEARQPGSKHLGHHDVKGLKYRTGPRNTLGLPSLTSSPEQTKNLLKRHVTVRKPDATTQAALRRLWH